MANHHPAEIPQFWRDPELSFIEARSIEDGSKICYQPHSHETFSIGAITGGSSTYRNGRHSATVAKGDVVLMNLEEVHACNPVDAAQWAYRMLYVDARWLAELQHGLGTGDGREMTPLATRVTSAPEIHAGLRRLHDLLVNGDIDILQKETAAVEFFADVHRRLHPIAETEPEAHRQLQRAADYIDAHCLEALRLEDICAAAGLSQSYLIRAFKKHYGMTPHAWQINRRIRHGRAQLRRGSTIADVALETGFADQAHFQRTFKKLVAATPAQYRGRS